MACTMLVKRQHCKDTLILNVNKTRIRQNLQNVGQARLRKLLSIFQ